jgi:hypothetical protein
VAPSPSGLPGGDDALLVGLAEAGSERWELRRIELQLEGGSRSQ